MALSTNSRSRQDYTIGWIRVVEPELIAARASLDEVHEKIPAVEGDSNNYLFGRIGKHNVVIASLPSGTYGTNSAAIVATQMSRSFPLMRFCLLVGIGGGVPNLIGNDQFDIRLGDVIVSNPTHNSGGVIQYDLGKIHEGKQRLERVGTLNKPPGFLLSAVAGLRASHKFIDFPLQDHLVQMIKQRSNLAPEYTHQGENNDILFEAGYKHEGRGITCVECLESKRVLRPHRQSILPRIHYGTIASGNQVVKDSVTRDYWRDTEGVLCFEMEAAGLMDEYPCLVIRGVCDYADSHKNKRWQPYAAATAAGYAKDLLLEVAPMAVQAAATPFAGEHPDLGNVYWMIPRSANTLFTGRTDILEKLRLAFTPQPSSLDTTERQKRFVIHGNGGVGKSEVCLKFVNDYRNHFWGILWIDASSQDTARQAFLNIGRLCGIDSGNPEQVRIWLATSHYSWLLIIDNADNPDLDYAAYFPSGNRGNIILTTRNPQCRDHATLSFEDMNHLDLQDAKTLLFKSAAISTASWNDKDNAAERILQDLGYHTLAIIQAGAYIKLRYCSFEDYPFQLKQQQDQLMRYRPKQAQSTYGSVFATFEISATKMEASQEQAAADALNLLQILGFFHFEEITELMFLRAKEKAISLQEYYGRGGPQNEIDDLSELQISRLPSFMRQNRGLNTGEWWRSFPKIRWREMLNLLESYSIINISGNTDNLRFSMHPLVHTWTRLRLDLEIRKEGWRSAGALIALSMKGLNYGMFFEKLRSHVRAYLDYKIIDYMDGMPGLEICQTFYHICCLTHGLRDISKLKILLQRLNQVTAWTCASERSSPLIKQLTALACREDGQYQEAVEILEQVVETWERSLEPEHNNLLNSKYELAKAYILNDQHKRAAKLLKQVVEISEKTLGPEHPHCLVSQHELASAYIESGQYKRAAELLEQVVEISERTLGPEHPDCLASQHELARAYMKDGQYKRAAELLEQVVEILKRTLEAEHPKRLASQHVLARAYIENEQYKRAAELLKQAVEIQKRTLEPEHPHRLTSQHELAVAYMHMGNNYYDRAAELLEDVVEKRRITVAADHPDRMGSEQLLEEVRGRIRAEEEGDEATSSGEAA